MSTQQDIYAAGSENRPPMLNKENYVPWSRMIPEPGDPNCEVPVNETVHVQTDDELTDKELKQTEADDQAIQTILLEKIASNLKFLNNLEPEWSRHVTIVHQTKDFHTTDYTQLYDFLKYNQKEVDDLKAERVARTQDPLALMATSNNPYTFPNVGNQVIQNAVQNPRIQNVRNQNRLIVVPGNANQNPNGNGNLVAARAEVRPRRRDAAYLQTQLLIAQKEEAGIQLQSEEFDLMAAAADLDEIEEVNANCILIANMQQASTSGTSGTQTDKAPVYDSDGLAEVHNYKNCYDNEIFNMFTLEEQYTELLEPIPKPHQVPKNDNNVISEVSSVEQSGETVEQHTANVEETRVLYDSLYNNSAIEVEKVSTVNRKLSETNAELTTELARYKNQENCFEISQEKYDKLERCYQNSGKQIMTLNEEISDLNKQLLVEKSTVSSLLEEKKRLKSDFKVYEDELLDKQIQIEKKIKELDNILVKTGQSIQMIHMLSPKPDSFYHTEQKMALGYQNPFYLKQA
nr:hypothetical protein [Tanacetum cinerariifolium]